MRINIILHGIPDARPVCAQVQELLHGLLTPVADRITALDFTVEQHPDPVQGERARCRISACLSDGQCARADRRANAWCDAVHRAGADLQAVLAWDRERTNRLAAGNAVIAVTHHPSLALAS